MVSPPIPVSDCVLSKKWCRKRTVESKSLVSDTCKTFIFSDGWERKCRGCIRYCWSEFDSTVGFRHQTIFFKTSSFVTCPHGYGETNGISSFLQIASCNGASPSSRLCMTVSRIASYTVGCAIAHPILCWSVQRIDGGRFQMAYVGKCCVLRAFEAPSARSVCCTRCDLSSDVRDSRRAAVLFFYS